MNPASIQTFQQRLPGIVYGGDYNPEQWPRETWHEDIRLMREANVRLVSLGVFSWSMLEPADGEYNFGWLDEIMDLLATNGISVNLATPNATPPPWLATTFPETLMVERNGTRVAIGSRGHFCPSSPVYRDRSQRIARLLAERYGDHPALAMWHIGNEYHQYCFCNLCDGTFRAWLQDKYGSLDELNSRWGTTFWGQIYSDWSQIRVPQPVRGWVNPARELDYARYNSEVQLDLYRQERDLLKSITPNIPATTNFVQFFPVQDYRKWAAELDVVALDIYPDPAKPTSLVEAALQYDLMRHMGDGAPWMMMEQAAGAVSQWKINVPKKPGAMRLGSYQAVSRGADAVMFFQWRASRFGQEKFHSAMLPHGGEATRSWQEVKNLGNELAHLDCVAGARSDANVAIVWEWDNWWAVEGAAHPLNNYSYKETVTNHYRALWKTNVAVDVVTLSSDLSQYRLVIVPNQYLITEVQHAALRAYVEGGGHVLVSYFSGIVNEDDQVIENGYPGGLRDVIGAHIRDFAPLPPEQSVTVQTTPTQQLLSNPFTVEGSRWQDDISTEGADVVAVYGSGHLAGKPAILDHQLGEGTAVYVGSHLPEQTLDDIIGSLIARAGVEAPHDVPENVEVTERHTDEHRYYFFLNHSEETTTVDLEISGTELLTGQPATKGTELTLEPAGVAVIQVER